MPRRRPPQPEFRQHRTLVGDTSEFLPGAAIAQAATIREALPFTSAQNGRIRFKATVGGTLKGKWLIPGLKLEEAVSFDEAVDGTAAVATTGNPIDVTVAANAEALLEVVCVGEAWLLLEFTEENAGAGVVTYCNVAQL